MADPSSSSSSSSSLIGDKGMIDKVQFVRLILHSLRSLNLTRSASVLESESDIPLYPPQHSSLLSQTLAGDWDHCIATVDSIPDLDPQSRSIAYFLIWKHHFLELLGSGNGLESARYVLFNKISPLDLDRRKVHQLARSLIDFEGVVRVEEREKRRMGLVMELMELMPDWIRVPSGRLERLVEAAVCKQIDSCFYHNSPDEVCLYEDHECGVEQIPCKCNQVNKVMKFVCLICCNLFQCFRICSIWLFNIPER